MALTIEVSIQGLREIQRLLATSQWYSEPWREGMTTFASRAGLAAQHGAPVGTGAHAGYLQARIRTAVQKRDFPTWIAIRNQARRRGFPYPRLLAFSPKHHHRDWLIKAVGPVIGDAGRVLQTIGAAIARNWSKG